MSNYEGISKISEQEGTYVRTSKDVASIAKVLLLDENKEQFLGIYLNTKNRIIRTELLALGTLDTALIHPREVYKPAILASAAALIIVHNHPSGDTQPSRDDIELTARLRDAGKILGIELLDHVITGKSDYLSFKEKEMI